MGHQTNYKQCKKCSGTIINTIAFGKKIITSNCKCEMESKEKAKELYNKFLVFYWHEVDGYLEDEKETKKLALLCCDELIENPYTFKFLSQKDYWTEVKKEIKKL